MRQPMLVRNLETRDHAPIITVVNDWWGGRPMAGMLPRLFFTHFQPSSFVLEDRGQLVAFLIGFISQTDPAQAYIHFVGVHPGYRAQGLGRQLYQHFFDTVQAQGCQTVRCVTSPVNTGSIAFHTHMGFTAEPGDSTAQGIAITHDYDGPGEHRVRFAKTLG